MATFYFTFPKEAKKPIPMNVEATLLGHPFDFQLWKSKGFGVKAFSCPQGDWSSDIGSIIEIEMVPLFPGITSESRAKRRRLESPAPIRTTKWRAIGAERYNDGLGDSLRVYVHRLDDFGEYTKLPLAIVNSVYWTSLTHLFLPKSAIEGLPSFISELDNLQAIDLSDSKIAGLRGVGKMRNLKHLKLRGTKIASLPHSIGGLESLQTLDLGRTKVMRLPPSIGKLTSLRMLDLWCTPIDRLPNNIGNLASLETLDLGHTRNLKSLPISIGKLTSLRKLELHYTVISMLPNSIGGLVKLEILSLRGARNMPTLPFSIGNLKNLLELDLSSSSIEDLPDTIGNLKNLSELNLNSAEDFYDLPDTMGDMIGLQKLRLSHIYDLAYIPFSFDGLKNLKELDLRHFNGTTLPVGLSKLTSLEVLNLSHSKISSMPPSIGALKNLGKLDLSCTQVSELPEDIGDLESLKVLNVGSTAITSLPDSIQRLPGPWVISIAFAGVFGNKRDAKTVGGFLLDLVENCSSLVDIVDAKEPVENYWPQDESFLFGIPFHWKAYVGDYHYFGFEDEFEDHLDECRVYFRWIYYHLGCNRARLRQSIQTPALWPHAIENAECAFECSIDDLPAMSLPDPFVTEDAIYQLIRFNQGSFLEMCIHRNARSNALFGRSG